MNHHWMCTPDKVIVVLEHDPEFAAGERAFADEVYNGVGSGNLQVHFARAVEIWVGQDA